MSSKPIDILEDLSKASAATRTGSRGKGKLARTPLYQAPVARSTRPKSDIGVTFHFAHKSLSKRNDISESFESATSASAHQGYIERKEAAAENTDELVATLKSFYGLPEQETVQNGADDQERRDAPGNQDRTTQTPIHDHPVHGVFSAPTPTFSEDRTGFGTNGKTPTERKEFWRKIEQAERRHGRVQSRIITELPFEITDKERLDISLSFCEELRNRHMPFWATIHAPSKKNDKRNYHLHVAYYDRPCAQSNTGVWDFEVSEIVVKKNRTKRVRKPLLQTKLQEVRDRGWVRTLRQSYATINNEVLEKGGYEKRLDARSYKDSGIMKEPTLHLGFKANAMETFGLDTVVGQENARREYRWKMAERVRRWDRAVAQEDVIGLFSIDDLDDTFFQRSQQRRTSLEEGRKAAVKSVQTEMLAQQIAIRVDRRKGFLDQEGKRLLLNGRGLLVESVGDDLIALSSEMEVLETRSDDILTLTQDLTLASVELQSKENGIWEELKERKTHKLVGDIDVFGSGLDEDLSFLGWGLDPNVRTGKQENINPPIAQSEDDNLLFDTDLSDSFLDDLVAKPTPENVVGQDKQETVRPTPTLENDQTTKPAIEAIQPEKRSEEIAWALLVERPKTATDIRNLDKKLIEMTNKDVRLKAIGTRDLVDFLDEGPQREAANRGWVVLRAEASRRGLNLDTGKQDLGNATDRERAERHRDEYLENVLQVRQEVARIRGR